MNPEEFSCPDSLILKLWKEGNFFINLDHDVYASDGWPVILSPEESAYLFDILGDYIED
jgi:hypothetical protein